MGVSSVKNRRKIFWSSPNLCFKYHGLKLFKLFLCLFEHEKMHNLILDDGQMSLGMDVEIPRFCPGLAIQERRGTVIIGLPLTRGRIAFGSDTRCTYKNGLLVKLKSGVEYQSPKLLRVDANVSMATCGDESFNLMVYQEVARKSMTEMRTTDGLASLVEKTMGAYYRDSIKSVLFKL
ncbi:uncharacterized protein LOC113319639 isoform X1 [Papaver somniferum]|uniref:uncharacterized protein LOC113319639 isoform X1 n=1 Tax=Papaver somniferum TaxID=3469 RepID=UPI000E705A25|nr:uncharacterized protein LOC113319639 isoform X1 [Papaver somniferum]